ncbi:tetratricopeptide repeat protein [Candidatus Poribacteria bacterium]|nr:tetratricopeptide repeat protein [Candidatus Poribacteria bacterium]
MAERSAYAILGLQKGAGDQEIKMAYVEMVKKYDPEKHTDRFMVIQDAYNRLKEPKKRAKEDIHTYNVATPDFLFLPNERVAPGQTPPGDDEIQRAGDTYRQKAGDSTAREDYVRRLMLRSHVAISKKIWSDAIRDWAEIQSIDPSHVRARQNLAAGYQLLGLSYALHELHEEAIELWEKALQINPDNADLVHNLALACERAGESQKAARYWTEAVNRWKVQLKKDGDNEYLKECIIEAHRYHGGQFETSAAPEQRNMAVNRYREVLKLRPDDFDAQFHIASSMMEENKYEEAIQELDKLQKRHPKNVEVLNLLGWAMLNSGKVDQGFNTWNRSLAIDPKNPATRENVVRAHLTLGKQYRQKGLFTPALVHLKKLLRYLPGSAEVFMEIAATYDMKGDTRSAQQAYEQVLAIDPKNKIARKALNDLRLRR